jgi:hypothetical protein
LSTRPTFFIIIRHNYKKVEHKANIFYNYKKVEIYFHFTILSQDVPNSGVVVGFSGCVDSHTDGRGGDTTPTGKPFC